MSRYALFAAVFALSLSRASAQVAPSAVLLRMPDVSADKIVFRYANDLWLVAKSGGLAQPLSSPDGAESFPKFSPDGSRIAFIASYDGGSDIYISDLAGGVPLRITHHPGGEVLCDWHPDGKSLVFYSSMLSGQQRAPKLFTIAATGGLPQVLPVPYGTFGAIDSTASWLAYTPVAQSEFRTWKRYQGGLAQDIWLFNLVTLESRRVTEHPGTDALPLWRGHELYFISDRDARARLNLWVYDVQKRTTVQVTDFANADARFPSIGPDDIVFENEGKLHRYEFATQKTVRVEISIPGDRPTLRPQTLALEDAIAGLSLGPNAKRVVVEARGEVFSVPVEEGVTRNLTQTDGAAERYPAWSPDGLWIAYWSDRSGEYELHLRRGDGAPFRWRDASEDTLEAQVTHLGNGWKYGVSWAPDSKSVAYSTDSGELWRIEIDSGDRKQLGSNPDAEPVDVAWSPDSRWLAWSHRHEKTRLNAIFLYDTRASALHELTSGVFDDRSPTFGTEGDWMYFVSSRTFEPTYSDFDDSWIYANAANIVAVPLRKDVKNIFAPTDAREDEADEDEADEDDDEKDDDSKGEKKDEAEDDKTVAAVDDAKSDEEDDEPKDKDKDKAPKPVAIDVEGFEARALVLPIEAGNLDSPSGGKNVVYYLRRPRTGEGKKSEGALVQFEMSKKKKEREEKVVLAGVQGFELARKAERILVALSKGEWAVIAAKPDQKDDKLDKLDFGALESSVDPRREWGQILADAHRIMRDFFYEPTLHGNDWRGVYERFKVALTDATSRDDLHFLMSEMIAELNVGHAYNSGGPGIPEPAPKGRAAGLLGCDFALEQGAFRITRILGADSPEHDARGPLAQPGVDARAGDWLLAVDGERIDAATNPWAALIGTVDRATELVLNQAPTLDGHERRVLVKPIESESELRYRDWVARTGKLVDELSKGRVGYVHVPDTGRRGQTELVRQLMSQYHKDALLIDERWNSGGQIPTRFIELLDRPRTNFWAVRHGDDWTWPPVSHHGPKAMLINGSSGSGGDAFPYYFRESKLGKLIGMRTWGGLVGISGNPAFIDGSSITVPRFAFYENDGTWGVEGYGVAPDIEVIDDPALMVHGEDPQLVAGVEHLLGELENFQFVRPRRPASPNRAGAGVTPSDR